MKKLTLLLFSLTFYFNGCTSKQFIPDEKRALQEESCAQTIRKHAKDNTKLNKILDTRIYGFQVRVEEMLVLHKKSALVLNTLLAKQHKNKPISAKELDILLSTTQKDIENIKAVAKILNTNTCWQKSEYKQLLISQVKIKGFLLELASTLFLYDYYLNSEYKVREDKRLRRLLNQGDSGYNIKKDYLMKLQDVLSDFSNLNNVDNHIKSYKTYRKEIKSLGAKDNNIAYLNQLIMHSPAYQLFSNKRFSLALKYRAHKQRNTIKDNLNALSRVSTNSISEIFGNIAGRYEERKGKLYHNKKIEKDIVKHLRSADILLEKTPFRLTDKMIPGYWGHAAIWIGNEKELRALGIWDHPVVKKYHRQIQAGFLVAESLRQGTTLHTLSHFLNIDDLAVLRHNKPISKSEKAKIIILALRQIGKAYDFNYDVETTDKIVCSQLVYLSYTDIEWPTESILGRYTISPDNIAVKVTKGKLLTTILLYVDGKEVKSHKNKTMRRLLEESQR